jgi:hypothetical protein
MLTHQGSPTVEVLMTTFVLYQKELEEVIAKVRKTGSRETVDALDGAEVYAYSRSEGRIAWGVNRASDGRNILRGIRLPDGTDTAEM